MRPVLQSLSLKTAYKPRVGPGLCNWTSCGPVLENSLQGKGGGVEGGVYDGRVMLLAGTATIRVTSGMGGNLFSL